MESLQKEAQEIQLYLESDYDGTNPEVVIERAKWLGHYMGRSGHMLADAEYHRDTFLSGVISETVKEALKVGGWPAQVTNKKIDAMAKEYNHLAKWIERINRTCTHQHQYMITLLSKHKEEMKMTQFSRNYDA